MEYSSFNMDQSRFLTDGNYNTYLTETLHPDRIMQEHDFIYLLDGEWDIVQGEVCYTMRADDVLILHAGQHHYGQYPCRAGTKTMYLHVRAAEDDRFHKGEKSVLNVEQKRVAAVFDESTAGIASSYNGRGEKGTENDYGLNCELPTLIHCSADPSVQILFRELISVWHDTSSLFIKCRIAALISLLLCSLYKCASITVSYEKKPQLVAEAVRLMEETPERFLSLRELTERLSASAKTLNRKFHQIYHMSAYQYQMELKLENVKAFLISNPHVKLKAVAMNFGFYDEFYMGKQFKRRYGMTPGEVRNKMI